MGEQSETTQRPGLLRRIGIVVATVLGFVVAIFLVPVLGQLIDPKVAIWSGGLVACVALLALLRPMPAIKLGHRGVSSGVIVVALLTVATGFGKASHDQEEMLSGLKQSDPQAYLAELRKAKGDDEWRKALKEIDPSAYEIETARYKAELQEQREAEERDRQAKQAREEAKVCKDKSWAWTMAKEFVTEQLRAPSTADFPWIREEWVKQTGECAFQVIGHVDAQNGFGAMIRSKWIVNLTYLGDGRWRRDSIAID